MALFETEFLSKELGIITHVTVFLPVDRHQWGIVYDGSPLKVLYLLHGAWSNHSEWLYRSNVINYAEKHNLAVVMPGVNNSCYTDNLSGSFKPYTFITEELPDWLSKVFPISTKPEDQYIAGLSMGGYGALKIALNNPDKYHAVASLSGAVSVKGLTRPDSFAGKDIFPPVVEGTMHDLEHVIKTTKPDIPMWVCCGTEDFLYETNKEFDKFCQKNKPNYQFHEGPGGHEWNF